MEIVRCFKKVERSYHSTRNGWRLATCEEAMNGLESIKEEHHLKEWERARLLDGWISGSGYDYEIRSEFRACMGYMLLIETGKSADDESGTPYGDVKLSQLGKEVALFLCVDDWNLEVVYWLLNSWSNSQTMELSDVRRGNAPFVNATEFKKMNEGIGRLARRLADAEVAAREKGRTTRYTGSDSVKEVLSSMTQIVQEEGGLEVLRADADCLPRDFKQTGDVAEVFWSFVCETYAGRVVEARSLENLQKLLSMKTKGKSSEKNLKIATFILRCLSEYRSDIIHEPLPHNCVCNCAADLLSDVVEKAGGDPDRLTERLKHNAMWRCYDDDTGNYGVLNKLLFSVTKCLGIVGRFSVAVVDMLLKCGAEPAPKGIYKVNNYLENTTLHNTAEHYMRKDVSREVAQLLLGRCDEESRSRFINAVNQRRMTALHIASERGNAILCQLLVDFSASLNAQDEDGMTPLHYALGEGADEVKNVFMKNLNAQEFVGLKDKRGNTPLDIAIAKKDYDSTAKLLSDLSETESYFSKVDEEQLLRSSLLFGSPTIVKKLYEKGIKLPAGKSDEDGRTALHLAAMRNDETSAILITDFILSRVSALEQDKTGRTALHEAALSGHEGVCDLLLRNNSKLLYMKDSERRNPLYDLVKGKYRPALKFLMIRPMESLPVEDLTDRRGLTPLHVAVSQGNVEFVKALLFNTTFIEKYLSREDFLGQTALHKAAKRGDIDTVKFLLDCAAHPLRERDCDGRTALHYAVQAEKGDKQKLAEALFERCESQEEKSLLLWASAAGLGTADQNLSKDDPLRGFLSEKKRVKVEKGNNLLRMAASVGDFEMTKELITRGYQMGEIRDSSDWKDNLDPNERNNVERVTKLIETVKEKGNDRPAIVDTLGRVDYAQGIAALFLNPYTKPPIAVGITGSWGMGKSSLMFQLEKFLNSKYDIKNRKVFKSVAAMDSSDMFELNAQRLEADRSTEENVPAVLTVQYNAWKYRNDTEALAGMAVEITKELEGLMTQAQWLSTCCRNTWRKNKYTLWVEIFFPSLLALVLLSSLAWIIWVVFDNDKLKEWGRAKYAWPPAAMIVTIWTVTRSVMGVLKPVSTQLMQYISFPDHSDKLGYQETVISDIRFLKEEIERKAYKVFIVFGWIFTNLTMLWRLITELWLWATSLFFHHRVLKKPLGVLKLIPASGNNLQIIVFMDDLDRCQESVILQVLSAINIVLAECEINVVMGMDKRLIQRAIMKKYGDGKKTSQELADMYLEKIIQLPLDLPDPSDEESTRFLKAQLGVYEHREEATADSGAEESFEHGEEASATEFSCNKETDEGSRSGAEEEKGEQQNAPPQVHISMPVKSGESERSTQFTGETNCLKLFKSYITKSGHALQATCRMAKTETGRQAKEEDAEEGRKRVLDAKNKQSEYADATVTGVQQNSSSSILIREMLFVRYSKGEENAFFYFQGLATDSRKLPREWKRLLNYHRLVWYIFSVSKDAKTLAGWQVQLITWIFVCWEWQDNMNIVIQKWKEIKWKEMRDLKTSETNGPSLLMIVEHLMEEHERENRKMIAIDKEEMSGKAGGIVSKVNKDEIESGDMELERLNGKGKGKISEIRDGEKSIAHSTDDSKIMEKGASQKLVKEIDKLDVLEKSLAELKKEIKKIKEPASDDLKEEMKELIKQVSDELKDEMEELKKQITDEFKKEMKQLKKESEVREQLVKRQKEQTLENKKNKLHNMESWKRMKSTLERYDVSMDGIQAFQKFRFYCIVGYLPCPSLKVE